MSHLATSSSYPALSRAWLINAHKNNQTAWLLYLFVGRLIVLGCTFEVSYQILSGNGDSEFDKPLDKLVPLWGLSKTPDASILYIWYLLSLFTLRVFYQVKMHTRVGAFGHWFWSHVWDLAQSVVYCTCTSCYYCKTSSLNPVLTMWALLFILRRSWVLTRAFFPLTDRICSSNLGKTNNVFGRHWRCHCGGSEAELGNMN